MTVKHEGLQLNSSPGQHPCTMVKRQRAGFVCKAASHKPSHLVRQGVHLPLLRVRHWRWGPCEVGKEQAAISTGER
jgi:hypothetical protein